MVLQLRQNNAKLESSCAGCDTKVELSLSGRRRWRRRASVNVDDDDDDGSVDDDNYKCGRQNSQSSSSEAHLDVPAAKDKSRMGASFSFYNTLHRAMRVFRRAITGVRFVDVDPEIYEVVATPRYKPECIDHLCKSTNFTKKELQTIYRSFKQACPSGLATESLLQDMYAQFFPHGDSSLYAHFVFKTFDHDGNGSLSFEEFVVGLSSLSRGTLEQKLQWTFQLYDINGDGLITRDELNQIVLSVYSLMGKDAAASALLVDDRTPDQHVDRVFKKMDLNEDGVVTIEEFMEICQKDESIRRSITALDTVL